MAVNTTEPVPRIAENLRALKRARDDLTWPAIARATGIAERQLLEYQNENGRYRPSWRNLCKIAAVFDVDPAYFYAQHTEDDE